VIAPRPDPAPRSDPGQSGTAPPLARKGYLDWLRGIGVLIMIQGHVIDSWTRAADRQRDAYHWITFVGGIGGAPLFLFLAGVALALAAGGRVRKGSADADAAALAVRRGWQIFGLAFLFRLQSWVISGGAPRALLKVDILNVMGLAMVGAAVIWGAGRTRSARAILLAASAVAVAMTTPIIRVAGGLTSLPDPLEWYLRPAPGMTTFTLFPWAAFLLAGGAVGVWLDAIRTARQERVAVLGITAAGLALAAGAYAASFLTPIYAQTNFWTSSPTFLFIRLGLVMALVGVAYAVDGAPWGWLREFGRASLFVYWIHVEMAYGILTAPLHRRLPLETAYVAFILFSLLLFGLVRLKNGVGTMKGANRAKAPAERGAFEVQNAIK